MTMSFESISPASASGAIKQTATDQKRVQRARELSVSYEFFPPKSKRMEQNLWSAIKALEAFSPDFVSVTYGAGGSTQHKTLGTVSKIAKETKLAAAAHMTCVDATQSEIDNVAKSFWNAGVRHIVALRGDSPDGIGQAYKPTAGGYGYASDLVEGLKKLHDFEVSVSAYPERHPESGNWDEELDNLKRKVDAGATRAITQFFFAADTFLRFQDRVADAGIDIPVVPGIMLQPNMNGLKRMSDMCGVDVPAWYSDLFEGLDDDQTTREMLTATLSSELTSDLYNRGVSHFHLYTLNRAEMASSVSRVLGLHHRRKASI